jgi:hypothetical protein
MRLFLYLVICLPGINGGLTQARGLDLVLTGDII